MADTFNTGVQIPNVPAGVTARDADVGYLRLYAREDRVYGRLANGTEVELTNVAGSGEPGDFPVFIQDNQPVTTSQKYLWVQTNFIEPGGLTLWVEDGT